MSFSGSSTQLILNIVYLDIIKNPICSDKCPIWIPRKCNTFTRFYLREQFHRNLTPIVKGNLQLQNKTPKIIKFLITTLIVL